jgi:hypothetical protein
MAKLTVNASDFICQSGSMIQFDKEYVSQEIRNIGGRGSGNVDMNFGIINLKIKIEPRTKMNWFLRSRW